MINNFLPRFALVFALTGGCLLQSCKHEVPTPVIDDSIVEDCSPNTVFFQQEVLPLFQSNCATSGCHDANTAQEGFVFTSYAGIMASGEIVAGNLNEGDIYEVITENDPDKIMPPPPNAPLTSEQIALIGDWISQGAQNTSCENLECDNSDVTYSGRIDVIMSNRCRGCHNDFLSEAGLNLNGHASVAAIAMNGMLMNAVNGSNGFTPMPFNGSPLSDCDKEALSLWIENGAPND